LVEKPDVLVEKDAVAVVVEQDLSVDGDARAERMQWQIRLGNEMSEDERTSCRIFDHVVTPVDGCRDASAEDEVLSDELGGLASCVGFGGGDGGRLAGLRRQDRQRQKVEDQSLHGRIIANAFVRTIPPFG